MRSKNFFIFSKTIFYAFSAFRLLIMSTEGKGMCKNFGSLDTESQLDHWLKANDIQLMIWGECVQKTELKIRGPSLTGNAESVMEYCLNE